MDRASPAQHQEKAKFGPKTWQIAIKIGVFLPFSQIFRQRGVGYGPTLQTTLFGLTQHSGFLPRISLDSPSEEAKTFPFMKLFLWKC